MPQHSAGLLMYRFWDGRLQVLLAHPGGPFWQHKDAGAWSIPKGEIQAGEEPLAAAQREFHEETGVTPAGPFLELHPIRQKSGKVVHAWAFAGDCDPAQCRSNHMQMQWPPGSGQVRSFPEIDRVAFFELDEARRKLNPAQVAFVDELGQKLSGPGR